MNLFFKIFLWFLAAIALMIGVVAFLNWTVQSEPVVSHWQNSVRNQMNVYAPTAAQVFTAQGQQGLQDFVARLRSADTVSEVAVYRQDGTVWIDDGRRGNDYGRLVASAFASSEPQLDLSTPDTSLAARSFVLPDGSQSVLIIRWERPHGPDFLGDSQARFLRYAALLIMSLLLCYALAKYLSRPIARLRAAAQKLASGDLAARVATNHAQGRDELAELASDFNLMAERIENLITSQKRLSRDISHELRSPLARMNVALEIVKQKSNGEISPMLQRIETESRRLNEMITRLLTLSQLESGVRDFRRESIDLTALIESVVDDADFEATAEGKSVRITRRDDAEIVGSASLMQSAVENVLRNAVRYTAAGSVVEVALINEYQTTRIAVRDRGPGVPAAELDNLFRPFYRIGEARERKTGGIGLGLAIAQQAVIAHGGRIRASNTGDGLLVEMIFDDAAISESRSAAV